MTGGSKPKRMDNLFPSSYASSTASSPLPHALPQSPLQTNSVSSPGSSQFESSENSPAVTSDGGPQRRLPGSPGPDPLSSVPAFLAESSGEPRDAGRGPLPEAADPAEDPAASPAEDPAAGPAEDPAVGAASKKVVDEENERRRTEEKKREELFGQSRQNAHWYAYDRREVICQLDRDALVLAENRKYNAGSLNCVRHKVAFGPALSRRLSKIASQKAWEEEAMMWLSTFSVFLRDIFPAVIARSCYGEEQRFDVTSLLFWKFLVEETEKRFVIAIGPLGTENGSGVSVGTEKAPRSPRPAAESAAASSAEDSEAEEADGAEERDRFKIAGTVRDITGFFQILYQETVSRFLHANKFAREHFESEKKWNVDMSFRFSQSRGRVVPVLKTS